MASPTPLVSPAPALVPRTPEGGDVAPAPSAQLIGHLGRACDRNGLPDLSTRLAELEAWVRGELKDFEAELAVVPRGARAVQRAAHHLLDLGGKHLRPMCVALASKLGSGFGPAARQLAVAVELVHTATLLHDDVVDVADTRRGKPAARALYGNAASIFAGDWLLVDALRRVRNAGVDGLLDRMLGIIEEMILAESLQLERRGRPPGSSTVQSDLVDYFRVVEGKTAALFRWAMVAGGKAGGIDADGCSALERFGLHLGVAFQAVDDRLDFDGDVATTGKDLFADVREGKLTYPLLIAIEREPALATLVAELAAEAEAGGALSRDRAGELVAGLHRTGALDATRRLAEERVAAAIAALSSLPAGPARDALVTVAEATLLREA